MPAEPPFRDSIMSTTWAQQAGTNTPSVWVTEYDPVYQLLALTVRSNTIAGAILKQFIYGYDKAGNRTSEQIQSGAGVPPAISTGSFRLMLRMWLRWVWMRRSNASSRQTVNRI